MLLSSTPPTSISGDGQTSCRYHLSFIDIKVTLGAWCLILLLAFQVSGLSCLTHPPKFCCLLPTPNKFRLGPMKYQRRNSKFWGHHLFDKILFTCIGRHFFRTQNFSIIHHAAVLEFRVCIKNSTATVESRHPTTTIKTTMNDQNETTASPSEPKLCKMGCGFFVSSI